MFPAALRRCPIVGTGRKTENKAGRARQRAGQGGGGGERETERETERENVCV